MGQGISLTSLWETGYDEVHSNHGTPPHVADTAHQSSFALGAQESALSEEHLAALLHDAGVLVGQSSSTSPRDIAAHATLASPTTARPSSPGAQVTSGAQDGTDNGQGISGDINAGDINADGIRSLPWLVKSSESYTHSCGYNYSK